MMVNMTHTQNSVKLWSLGFFLVFFFLLLVFLKQDAAEPVFSFFL
jgi:hypothetical protein